MERTTLNSHIMGYWRCNLNIERPSNLRRFERRRGASGVFPFFIQSPCRILAHSRFEPTTDLGIGNTRLGDTTRILVGRNCTLYLRMPEKFINNGVELHSGRVPSMLILMFGRCFVSSYPSQASLIQATHICPVACLMPFTFLPSLLELYVIIQTCLPCVDSDMGATRRCLSSLPHPLHSRLSFPSQPPSRRPKFLFILPQSFHGTPC